MIYGGSHARMIESCIHGGDQPLAQQTRSRNLGPYRETAAAAGGLIGRLDGSVLKEDTNTASQPPYLYLYVRTVYSSLAAGVVDSQK